MATLRFEGWLQNLMDILNLGQVAKPLSLCSIIRRGKQHTESLEGLNKGRLRVKSPDSRKDTQTSVLLPGGTHDLKPRIIQGRAEVSLQLYVKPFVLDRIIFHMNNCKPTFAPPGMNGFF